MEIIQNFSEPIQVILADQRMPDMLGTEFLKTAANLTPYSVRILLTGFTDVQSVIQAINEGQVYRYVSKPWDPADLLNTIEQAIDTYNLRAELKTKNQQLADALESLKTLDQAKDQFMMLINHELKTPLTTILSYSELLAESTLSVEQTKYLQRIQSAGERLRNIVDDVLLVLKSETQSLKLNTRTFSSTKISENLQSQFARLAEQRHLKISWQLPAKLLVGDEQLIIQVFHRLLHNALKYAAERTTIFVEAEMSGPHRMRFAVRNVGKTISDKLIAKIQRPFFLDENVLNHSTGMGLGLTICHSILKAHKSHLIFENLNDGVSIKFEVACL